MIRADDRSAHAAFDPCKVDCGRGRVMGATVVLVRVVERYCAVACVKAFSVAGVRQARETTGAARVLHEKLQNSLVFPWNQAHVPMSCDALHQKLQNSPGKPAHSVDHRSSFMQTQQDSFLRLTPFAQPRKCSVASSGQSDLQRRFSLTHTVVATSPRARLPPTFSISSG